MTAKESRDFTPEISEYTYTEEEDNDLNNIFKKMKETLNDEMKKSFKEMEEKIQNCKKKSNRTRFEISKETTKKHSLKECWNDKSRVNDQEVQMQA